MAKAVGSFDARHPAILMSAEHAKQHIGCLASSVQVAVVFTVETSAHSDLALHHVGLTCA